MNEADLRGEATRWLRYSEEDLHAAESLLEMGVPRQACSLAQQSAEKALKAVLVFLQIDFPRSHDLDTLRALIPSGWTVATACPDLAELTEWAVEARYPGSWPEATLEDAKAAVIEAQVVCRAVHDDLAPRL